MRESHTLPVVLLELAGKTYFSISVNPHHWRTLSLAASQHINSSYPESPFNNGPKISPYGYTSQKVRFRPTLPFLIPPSSAALRRGVAASRDPSSSRFAATAPVSARLFSADASGEAAATAAGSQEDPFLEASREGLAYGRFYSVIGGGNRLERNMLKTDIIHHLDRCGLSLDDVKIDYNRGFTPLAALLRFPSKAVFSTAIRQTIQNRLYKIEEISRDVWDLKQSFDGKAVLLQGVPWNALPEDIERFLCGTNFEPSSFESIRRPGVPEPIRMVLVKFRTKTDAMNAVIAKNRMDD